MSHGIGDNGGSLQITYGASGNAMVRHPPTRCWNYIHGLAQCQGETGACGLVIKVRHAPHVFTLQPIPWPQQLIHQCWVRGGWHWSVQNVYYPIWTKLPHPRLSLYAGARRTSTRFPIWLTTSPQTQPRPLKPQQQQKWPPPPRRMDLMDTDHRHPPNTWSRSL